MRDHIISAAEYLLSSADTVVVIHKIVVYKIALVSISAPNPSVSLNTVKISLTGVKVQGICSNVVDLVYCLVVALECALILKGNVLVICKDIVCGLELGNEYVSESNSLVGFKFTVNRNGVEYYYRILGIERLFR